MHSSRVLIKWLLASVVALLGFAATANAQGITTAAMTGLVTDHDGNAVAKATVTVVHQPTGSKATTVTRANGRYDLSGLRVGGPYTVTVATPANETSTQENVYLNVGGQADVDFALGTDIVKMETFTVTGERIALDTSRMGTSQTFTASQLAIAPSARNNIQDIARMDPRITLNSLDQGGQMSAQGQNFRFNSFLVDGVESIDPFGLNSNGFASLRGPVPLDSVQSLSVELNPIDVRRSGFTGALINVVTKSGGNEFAGSIGYEMKKSDISIFGKNFRMRGQTPSGQKGSPNMTWKSTDLDSRTWTVNFSGPIIPGKLFFAFSYEDYKQVSSAPTPGINISGTHVTTWNEITSSGTIAHSMRTIDAMNEALRIAHDLYGYDAGTIDGGTGDNLASQKTYSAKIDWNITNNHRAVFSYNRIEGTQPNFAGYTSTTGISASNYWFDIPRTKQAFTVQVNSQWTPDLRTEGSLSYNTYDGTPKNRGTPFPSVGIGGFTVARTSDGSQTTAYLNFGTEYSRQMNQLNTKQWLGKANAEYSIGKHTFVGGVEYDATHFENKYAQNVYGNYTFSNISMFEAGNPTQYQNTKVDTAKGYRLEDLYAIWTYTNYVAYIQDTWKPHKRFTLTGGLRIDYPDANKAPKFNADFAKPVDTANPSNGGFGMRNDTTINGNFLISPRIGFNYTFNQDQKNRIRGSVGMYQARSPGVWLSNAYQNSGAGASVSDTNSAGLGNIFTSDVNNQPTPDKSLPAPNMNVTDPDFMMPSLWKGNIAYERKIDVLGGIIATVEASQTYVNKGLYLTYLNYKVATGNTTMPDGRIRYAGTLSQGFTDSARSFVSTASTAGRRNNTKFADVYYLTNTHKGESSDVTLSLNRPMKDNWSAGIAWTHNKATEVNPMTSSTAGSLYSNRAVYNPNEDVASKSNTNTKHKIAANFTYVHNWAGKKKWPLTSTLTYEALSGRPYSWIFKGDANGDGFTYNDLLYVPTGPTDPKVSWYSTTERDAFFNLVESTSLKNYKGQVVPRNSETSPWQHTFHITLSQEIPIFKKVRSEVYCNLLNFANLLNRKWGIKYEVPFSYKRSVVATGYDAAGNGGQGQYKYSYNPVKGVDGAGVTNVTLDAVPVAYDEVSSSDSLWELVIGCRIRF